MKEISMQNLSLASGIGGSKKTEQFKESNENYNFGDALAEKETKEDKVEKKEMERSHIEKEETKQEVDKKEYEKFMERQNILIGSGNVNSLAASQQMANNLMMKNQMNNPSMMTAGKGNQMINKGDVGLKELQKLMAQRGISFSQLDAGKLSKLSTMHSSTEVSSFLNQLVKELKYDKDEKGFSGIGNHQFLNSKKENKSQKVNKMEDVKKVGDKEDEKDDKLQETSSAATNVDKQNVAFGNFFEGAKVSEFQQGGKMEQQILQQIISKMDIDVEKAKSEVSIKLNPEYLGEARLTLVVDKDKKTVSVNCKTTSRESKKALEGNIKSLEEAFAKSGLKMEKCEISLVDEVV